MHRDGDYSVAVTRGIIDALDNAELECVLAHELTHIRNRDVQLLIVSTILVGVVPIAQTFVVRGFWILIEGLLAFYRGVFTLLPMTGAKPLITFAYNLLFVAAKGCAFVIAGIGRFCSLLLSFALSRRREYLADAGAIELTKNPDALISALLKVAGHSDIPTSIDGIGEMFFDNSLISGPAGFFATHPSIESRVDAIIRYGRDVAKGAAGI
jgi:heat shock protein HtpX